jgi:membrane associated rhomboid family serine protease
MEKFQETPVCVFIVISLVMTFSLYVTSIIKTIPCGSDFTSIFWSNFIHSDLYHLSANVFALYALSRVERKIGMRKFISLLVFLLFVNTLIEAGIKQIYPSMECSIGFSGVLFGIMTWELVQEKTIDSTLLLSIIALVIGPSLIDSSISIVGHSVGAFTGIVGGLLWKKLNKPR